MLFTWMASVLLVLSSAESPFLSLAFRNAPEKGFSSLHAALQLILKKTSILYEQAGRFQVVFLFCLDIPVQEIFGDLEEEKCLPLNDGVAKNSL